MIEVEQLVFDYPSRRALHGVDFCIAAGSITALVGPNGAGKSTLLRCLAALYRPFSGQVRINGFDTAEQPRQVHQSLGYLSDFFGLYDNLSVRRSLLYACRTHEVNEARVEQVAAQLGLSSYLQSLAGELSRGLRQRLAIGLAIIHQPPVLLLDEPASDLDPEARIGLSQLFLDLRQQGMTLLVSSHILAELEGYASDVLIIDGGHIIDHHPLRVSEGRCELLIELSRPDGRLRQQLEQHADLSLVQADERLARVQLGTSLELHQALLAELVGAGLPVARFGPLDLDLQQVYVERLRQARGQVFDREGRA
jgi:ABC-2 type transport system ATP-binding protein